MGYDTLKGIMIVSASIMALPVFGFEDCKVLPKGVRKLYLRLVDAQLNDKTDSQGGAQSLGTPLERKVSFATLAKGESAVRQRQLEALLLSNNMSKDDQVGEFSADIKGRLNVFAPILAYGATSRLTLVAAQPIYRAQTSVAVGFKASPNAKKFMSLLNDPYDRQVATAQDAARRINGATELLNQKLVANGYTRLQDWQETGLGDFTSFAKYQMVNASTLRSAATGGFIAPTGRLDDPDNLTDIGFGNGAWALFGGLAADEFLVDGLFLNQYAKYTSPLPSQKPVRQITDNEYVEVEKRESRFKLGDQIEAGVSAQLDTANGIQGGVGYSYLRKFADVYRVAEDLPTAGETKAALQANTDQEAHYAEVGIGYSAVNAYQRKAVSTPFEVNIQYKRQLSSRNLPVANLVQTELNTYF